jgi:hypothetical protein
MGMIGTRYSNLFVLLAYLTVISIAMIIQYRSVGRLLINELGSTWKEVVVA